MKQSNNEDAAATLLQANARRSQAKKDMQAKRDDKEQVIIELCYILENPEVV